MHSAGMSAGSTSPRETRLQIVGGRGRINPTPSRFTPLADLRRLRGSEQVAAVCYRVRKSGMEFLLVRTRGGRWTFPKGGAEPGLTHAQAAALEAFEEAGVHGRMEELSFTRYVRRRRGEARDSAIETVVNAHLCEVLWLDPPQEADRNPTWFSPEKAKRRLREDRGADFAAEFARVVDLAVGRIQRLHA
jgi:8-oxo-dGTP pyrophosphatase MutT (NUDIX family)